MVIGEYKKTHFFTNGKIRLIIKLVKDSQTILKGDVGDANETTRRKKSFRNIRS